MRCLAGLLVVVVGLCSTVSLLVGIRGALPVWPESFPEEVMYPFLDPIFEGDWMATLSKGRIHHVEVWNPYGLSEKFKVIFEDGKLSAHSGGASSYSSVGASLDSSLVNRRTDRAHRRYSRSSAGEYQAMSEIGAFYVDRALGWRRKPPTSGRLIPSHTLYAMDDSWWGFMQRALPNFDVEVSLIAWFDGIAIKAPEDRYLEVMLHLAEPKDADLDTLRQIANVMVFDFLVDDHDRIESHNWLKDSRGSYIFWDSGLAFRHGTSGRRDRDRDIFCGRREWVALTSARSENKTCQRTCLFSKSTIDQLRQFGFSSEDKKQRLSLLVRSEMRKDPLYPVFHYNAYLPGSMRFPKVNYKTTDFLEGLDIRLQELLLYVDECVEQFGEQRVLINDI